MINDCTLLLSTYDGGEDLWEGFFTALTTQWPGFNLPIVVNTETKTCKFRDLNIRTVNSGSGKRNAVWGRRLIKTLQNIETEYILFFLDDFWLDAPVDVEHFEKCRQWMRDNPDVASISFQRTRGKNIKDGRFERFEKRPTKGTYRLNCQAALWRKDILISYIMPHESAWEWEEYGTIRSEKYVDALYSIIEEAPKVFSYNLSMGGVIHRGKWVREVVVPLQERYNISIDYEKRGFWEDYAASGEKRKRNIIRGIKNRIHKIRSING